MRALAGLLAVAGLLAGCGGSSSSSSTASQTTAPQTTAAHVHLSSPAFGPGTAIPPLYTCDGRDISPPLAWTGVPGGATELTITMRDRDAPGGTFLHWSVSHIPPASSAFAAGAAAPGAKQARNDFGKVGYGGPCPPAGDKPHHYVITVSALEGTKVLATGTLVATYARR